jgi:hypothetical protein
MKTLTIQVPDPVFQWLDAAARRRQQTPEQAASEALATAARSSEPTPEEPSCFDLMKPAWRSIKGPKDLSQREGFGE